MKDPRDEFIPYWLQTAAPSGGNGGILGQLAQPVDPPSSYPWPLQSSTAEFDPSTLPISISERILPPPKSIWGSNSPLWLQTALPSGAALGLPALPDPSFKFPWEYPWPHKSPLDTRASSTPPNLFGLSPTFPPAPPPSSGDPSSPSLRHTHVGANAGFPALPARPVVKPWNDPWPIIQAQTNPFALSPTLPSAPPLQHLDSGKYWPAALAPSGASAQPPAQGFYFSPVPQAPSWDQVPTHAADSAARSISQPPSPAPWATAAPPVEYPNLAKYWGAPPTPSAASVLPPAHSFYPSSLPEAPSRNSVPTSPADRSAQTFAESRSRSFWSDSAGNPDGERGTSYADGTESIPEILSDVTPDNYWIPGADYAADGHHEFPRANYKEMPPETRKIFDEAKTGKLFVRSINGGRHEFDEFHRQYNKATGDLLDRFMRENNVAKRPDLMTPDHARAVLKAIAESEDPRIRHYAEFIRRLRLFYRLRGGDQ
jgi:hypothetical protein